MLNEFIEWFEWKDYKSYDVVYPDNVLYGFEQHIGERFPVEFIKRITGDKHRWYTIITEVYKYEDEYFGIVFREPNTEMQSGQGTGIKLVKLEPYKVTITKYREVE